MKTPIAVFGLGRSGLSIAKAALAKNWDVRVYDQAKPEKIAKPELLAEAEEASIPLSLAWDGIFQETPATLIINPAVPSDHPVIVLAKQNGIEVIGEIEFAFRISKAPIVAITGTNGKSTTTVMTYLCLQACGKEAVLCGNIFGSGYSELSLTDAAAASTPDQILVAEVSSFQLEWTNDFRPAVSGITNIWPDHMDRYASFADYSAAKHRMFKNQGQGDFAVVKANDPAVTGPGQSPAGYVPRGRRRPSAQTSEDELPTVLTFGSTGKDARVEEHELQLMDKKVRLDELPFDEPHNYQNACMAALLAQATLEYSSTTSPGVMPGCVIDGLKSFRGLAHRMELVGSHNGIKVINNSMCTNPDAVIKSVQAVKDRTHLLIGGANKGLDFGPLKHYLSNHRHRTYVYGRDGEELAKMLGGNVDRYATMQEAFIAATNHAKTNEVIMLAPGCASSDSFRDFRDRGDVFRSLAKEWLEK